MVMPNIFSYINIYLLRHNEKKLQIKMRVKRKKIIVRMIAALRRLLK